MRRACELCKGAGVLGNSQVVCDVCRGAGVLPEPDVEGILLRLRGPNGGLRREPPTLLGELPALVRRLFRLEDVLGERRAYYVWHLALHVGYTGIDAAGRYPGGEMVFLEGLRVMGDPWRPELETLARAIARYIFGTDRAEVIRLARLGFDTREESARIGTLRPEQVDGPLNIDRRLLRQLLEIYLPAYAPQWA